MSVPFSGGDPLSPPVVVCAGFDWRHPSPLRHLELEMARDHRVLHIESLALRAPRPTKADLGRLVWKVGRLTGVLDAQGPAQSDAPGPGVQVLAPAAVPWHGSAVVRSVNTRLLKAQVDHVRRRLGGGRPRLFLTSLPTSLGLMSRVDAEVTAYYRVDDWASWPGVDADPVADLEAEMMATVDLTFCTSRWLLERSVSRSGPAIHLPQGVDLEHFARARDEGPVYPGLGSLPRPILGFFGTLDDRLDPAILERLAAWPGTVLLAGPRTPDAPRFSGPGALREIGAVDYDRLPELARGVDAWILPYVLGPRTEAIDPLKLREYLATGRPVVSTALPEVAAWQPHVAFAGTPEEFYAAAQRAVEEPDDAPQRTARIAALEGQSWSHRRRVFLDAVEGSRAGR